jgi:hypothetical protein
MLINVGSILERLQRRFALPELNQLWQRLCREKRDGKSKKKKASETRCT